MTILGDFDLTGLEWNLGIYRWSWCIANTQIYFELIFLLTCSISYHFLSHHPSLTCLCEKRYPFPSQIALCSRAFGLASRAHTIFQSLIALWNRAIRDWIYHHFPSLCRSQLHTSDQRKKNIIGSGVGRFEFQSQLPLSSYLNFGKLLNLFEPQFDYMS